MKQKVTEEHREFIISERRKWVGTARIAKMVWLSESTVNEFITNVNRPQWMLDEEKENEASEAHRTKVEELAKQSAEMHRNDRYYLAAA